MDTNNKDNTNNAWQQVERARHADRPRMMFFIEALFEDFIELHGDRCSGDDPAIVGGLARFNGETVMVIGQQKGVATDEKVYRNFGMAHPEGYRKALRLMRMAEQFSYPILNFVDTPAAYPGIEAEARGQGSAIAQNLLALFCIKSPIFAVVLSEGGSGGALGIAVADYIVMFEGALYMICPPERCAEILWRDSKKKGLAAQALKAGASDLLAGGLIDKILSESEHNGTLDPAFMAANLRKEIAYFLKQYKDGYWSVEQRQQKFRNIGVWNLASHD
ncbi:MAG: acetyl-CoA carboxylase carboxyl transferase subunit alpha [Candidatus Hydrogenedentes bacterium]|nr:acetyl-CoA carboxylase carboxyl transferase subunit alpha [Candidatus Hydrogenedentota bacterium]